MVVRHVGFKASRKDLWVLDFVFASTIQKCDVQGSELSRRIMTEDEARMWAKEEHKRNGYLFTALRRVKTDLVMMLNEDGEEVQDK